MQKYFEGKVSKMEDINHLMIVWTYSPLFKSIEVFNARGKVKSIGSGREIDFLITLDEYTKTGYEVINVVGQESVFRAFLRKKTT